MKSSGEAKLFLGILIVAVLLVGVAVYPMITGRTIIPPPPQAPPPDIVQVKKQMLIPAGSHIKGDPNLPFMLVEFGDYQCGSCAKSMPVVDKIVEENKSRMSYVFHPYQAAARHQSSAELAYAAEAAGEQGKFWEMHEALFKRIGTFEEIEPEDVIGRVLDIAQELKLDIPRFKQAYGSVEVQQKWEDNMKLGHQLRIDGTPGYFFVSKNGTVTQLHNTLQLMEYLKDKKHWM